MESVNVDAFCLPGEQLPEIMNKYQGGKCKLYGERVARTYGSDRIFFVFPLLN